MKPVETRSSLRRSLQHKDPNMAPKIIAGLINPQEYLSLNHKLRKPLVEKLRRERINSSIEQLMTLLSPEFFKKQPDSKLEKADILEMTVCFLRRLQKHPAVETEAVDLGYSRSVQEVVHFLSKDEQETQSQRRLLNHCKVQISSDDNLPETDLSSLNTTVQTNINKDKHPNNSTLWRPW